jgi:hypothetical protein
MPIPVAGDTYSAHFAVSNSPQDRPRAVRAQCTTVSARASVKIGHVHTRSGFPGQLGLIQFLAADVFEEVGIDFGGEAGVQRPNWRGWV